MSAVEHRLPCDWASFDAPRLNPPSFDPPPLDLPSFAMPPLDLPSFAMPPLDLLPRSMSPFIMPAYSTPPLGLLPDDASLFNAASLDPLRLDLWPPDTSRFDLSALDMSSSALWPFDSLSSSSSLWGLSSSDPPAVDTVPLNPMYLDQPTSTFTQPPPRYDQSSPNFAQQQQQQPFQPPPPPTLQPTLQPQLPAFQPQLPTFQPTPQWPTPSFEQPPQPTFQPPPKIFEPLPPPTFQPWPTIFEQPPTLQRPPLTFEPPPPPPPRQPRRAPEDQFPDWSQLYPPGEKRALSSPSALYSSHVSPAGRIFELTPKPPRTARFLKPGEKLPEDSNEMVICLRYHIDIDWPNHLGLHKSDVETLAVESMPSAAGYCDLIADDLPALLDVPGIACGTTVRAPLPARDGVGMGSQVKRHARWVSITLEAVPSPVYKATTIEGQTSLWTNRVKAQRKLDNSMCLSDAPIVTLTIRNVSDLGAEWSPC
jgi:hypothetical protein